MQLIVLGMHRSGTSLVAGLLNKMGACFGPSHLALAPQDDNPKGFWERSDVVALNDRILSAMECSWCDVSRFDLTSIDEKQTGLFCSEISSIINDFESSPILLKDPRICLTLPLWRPRFKKPVGVFVVRDPLETAKSLLKRDNIPLHVGLALWEFYTLSVLRNVEDIPLVFIRYQELVANPQICTRKLHKELSSHGVEDLSLLSEDTLAEFVDQTLYHQKGESSVSEQVLNLKQQQLYTLLNSEAPDLNLIDLDCSLSSMETLNLYHKGLILDRITKSFENSMHNNNKSSLSSQGANTAEPMPEEGEVVNYIRDARRLQSSLELEINCLRESEQQALAWGNNFSGLLSLTYDSRRWKIGNAIGRLIDIVTFKPDRKTVEDHAREELKRYGQYLLSRGERPTLDQVEAHQTEMSRVELLAKCSFVAIRNPRAVLSVLTPSRLKKLLVLVRENDGRSAHSKVQGFLRDMGIIPEEQEGWDKSLYPEWDGRQLSLPDTDEPLISIVLPVYNGFKMTMRCLSSIVKNTEGCSYEVILADDCSDDETLNIGQHVSHIRISRTSENLGFLRNCNSAAKSARGQFLLFLNNDTFVTDGWLSSLLETLTADEKIGIVGSKLVFPDGRLQECGGIIWNDATGWNYGKWQDPLKPEFNYCKETDYVSGASLMIRWSLWETIGGFDDRYVPAYYEDTDLAFEVRKRGYKVVCQPKSVVVHFEGGSHGTSVDTGLKSYQLSNQEKFADKWSESLSREHYSNGTHLFRARDRSQAKKIILVIDHYVPTFDKDAGSQHTFQYLKFFVESGLKVIFMGDNLQKTEPYTSVLQNLGVEVLYGKWFSGSFRKWFIENADDIDYVYLHRPHIAENHIDLIRKTGKSKILYFGHDLHFLRLQRQAEIENNAELVEEANEWKKRECALFEKSDVIYFPSYVETEKVKELYPEKIARTIPLYIVDPVKVSDQHFDEKRDIFFVGGFRHVPNVDGVFWFVNEVFPLVQEQLSGIRFHVAGSMMPEEIRCLASESVVIHGEVSETKLNDLYASSRVVVVPLRFGAGIKGKVLEALFKQVPLVTTDVGAEGLNRANEYLSIANDAKEFASCVIDLYQDKEKWMKQVCHGVEAVNRDFSKKKAHEALSDDLELKTDNYS